MLSVMLLVMLPVIVTADIRIIVNVGDSINDSSVEATGFIVEPIPESERNAWSLSDEKLLDAFGFLFGKTPDSVYLKPPPEWKDLFKQRNWQEVQRKLVPTSARIVSVNTQPSQLFGLTYDNSTAKKFIKLLKPVQQSITNTWRSGFSLEVDQDINYDVNFKRDLLGGISSHMSYTNLVGRNLNNTNIGTFGNVLQIISDFPSMSGVRGELYASKHMVEIEVNYNATLIGVPVFYYSEKYKEMHFLEMDIDFCQAAVSGPTEITARETINLEYFTQGRIVLTVDLKESNESG